MNQVLHVQFDMKKHLKEWFDLFWIWGPMLLIILVLYGNMYYTSHYCKEYTYKSICRECAEWKTTDNGHTGRYRREWTECVRWVDYECELTDDSCGCVKLK